jgi:hypothetical protein
LADRVKEFPRSSTLRIPRPERLPHQFVAQQFALAGLPVFTLNRPLLSDTLPNKPTNSYE